ncbi:TetR/AcrR family transcriptional regulator [Blastococcus capsensis]|uniref:TetR/AcrR family transcriptional regulator n=1 Tax=Blastococcus capsensis TaxID=1564163 RepID=UPI00254245F3|nr:TetR/AcrR family transcriptional regulator [Blastococcus capsensis]
MPDRRSRRRQDTIEEALHHGVQVITEQGVGALTISEVARRLGMRAPSLYKYFPSGLHALYDALFARGMEEAKAATERAVAGLAPGAARLRAAGRGYVRWAVENPGLAQLLHWRAVPGFEPSPGVMALSHAGQQLLADELQAAVDAGELRAEANDEEAIDTWTVLLSGLMTQQMANEPGAPFDEGRFTRLTDPVLDLWFERYGTH